jgi:hypothetical protein
MLLSGIDEKWNVFGAIKFIKNSHVPDFGASEIKATKLRREFRLFKTVTKIRLWRGFLLPPLAISLKTSRCARKLMSVGKLSNNERFPAWVVAPADSLCICVQIWAGKGISSAFGCGAWQAKAPLTSPSDAPNAEETA